MLKVGLIGVGGISCAHIPHWEGFEDAELVALCDIRPERTEPFKDKRCYTDFDEMLRNENLDILDICLPTYMHADFAVKALEQGINVICEKPVSLKKSDVARIYIAAEENNVKFMVAHVLRFWTEYEFIKSLIDSQKYGKLLSGNMNRLSSRPRWSWDGWMQDYTRSGAVPFDLHIHDLDFLVYALGKPTDVKSFRSKRPEQDVIEVIYSFGDCGVNCESTWYAAQVPFSAGYRFQFERAVVYYSEDKLTLYTEDGQRLSDEEIRGNDLFKRLGLATADAYANELRYFADCVLQNKAQDKIKPEELETVIDTLNSL